MLSWRFTCFLLFLEVPGNHLEELHVAVDLLEEVVLIVLVVVYLVVRHLKYISKIVENILDSHCRLTIDQNQLAVLLAGERVIELV